MNAVHSTLLFVAQLTELVHNCTVYQTSFREQVFQCSQLLHLRFRQTPKIAEVSSQQLLLTLK